MPFSSVCRLWLSSILLYHILYDGTCRAVVCRCLTRLWLPVVRAALLHHDVHLPGLPPVALQHGRRGGPARLEEHHDQPGGVQPDLRQGHLQPPCAGAGRAAGELTCCAHMCCKFGSHGACLRVSQGCCILLAATYITAVGARQSLVGGCWAMHGRVHGGYSGISEREVSKATTLD